jgi:hypothetical protein
MNKNLDSIAKDLYGKIETRFPNIKIGDENAGVLSKKTDIPKARFFEFEYEEDGEKLGTIAITLDEDDGIIVQISGKLADSKHYGAFRFIRSFRQFAKNRLLNFDVQNIGKDHLDKRDYNFQAKPKEEPVMQPQQPVMESKMYGNARMSYQDLGEARLVIKHSQAVNPEVAAGRTMHIDSIYVENADGERFKYPFKHLNGARAMAEHLKHGGIPYDSIGKHITSLSEELAQLRKFKGYVSRNEALSEAMGDITSKVFERIEEVKKEVAMLQRPSYYETFAESFEDREEQMIPEEIMSDWIDRLTIRTFNEDLKTAFPYIFRLVDESEIPVKELTADDLLSDAYNPNSAGAEHARSIKANHRAEVEKKAKAGDEKAKRMLKAMDDKSERMRNDYNARMERESIDPEKQFESFMDRLMNEDEETAVGNNNLFSSDIEKQAQAVDQLKQLIAGGLQPGVDGINAVASLKGIIDSEQFTEKYLKGLSDSDDVGTAIKLYLKDIADGELDEPFAPKAKEIAQQLLASKELDVSNDIPVGGEEVPPDMAAGAPPAPDTGMPPGGEVPPPDMAAGAPPEAGAVPPGAPPAPPAPVAESMAKLKAKIIKVLEAGASLDTELDFGHRVMSLGEACNMCGIKPEPEEQTHEAPIEEMIKSISGFFNPQEKNFTIGGTRAKIKVLKDFKNGVYKGAKPHHVKQVLLMIDKLDPSGQQTPHHDMDHGHESGNPQDIHLSVGKEQIAMPESTTNYEDLKRIVSLVHYR